MGEDDKDDDDPRQGVPIKNETKRHPAHERSDKFSKGERPPKPERPEKD